MVDADADDLPGLVHERSACAAAVRRGIRLEHVERLRADAHAALHGGNAAVRHGGVVKRRTERMGEHIDGVARCSPGRIAELRGLQCRLRLDLQNGQITALVHAGQGRRILRAIAELHRDALRAGNGVRVRDKVAVRRHDDGRAAVSVRVHQRKARPHRRVDLSGGARLRVLGADLQRARAVRARLRRLDAVAGWRSQRRRDAGLRLRADGRVLLHGAHAQRQEHQHCDDVRHDHHAQQHDDQAGMRARRLRQAARSVIPRRAGLPFRRGLLILRIHGSHFIHNTPSFRGFVSPVRGPAAG